MGEGEGQAEEPQNPKQEERHRRYHGNHPLKYNGLPAIVGRRKAYAAGTRGLPAMVTVFK